VNARPETRNCVRHVRPRFAYQCDVGELTKGKDVVPHLGRAKGRHDDDGNLGRGSNSTRGYNWPPPPHGLADAGSVWNRRYNRNALIITSANYPILNTRRYARPGEDGKPVCSSNCLKALVALPSRFGDSIQLSDLPYATIKTF
jgi:hypothetical protein